MTDDQYINLKTITFGFIHLDRSMGLEIKLESIDSYIDKALSLAGIPCDLESRKRLFSDIEYQFKITHANGHAIFDEYDDRQNWYSNDMIENKYFWNRYKTYLLTSSSIGPRSINLLDEETLPNIMNCLGNPQEKFEGKKFRRGLIIGDVQSGKTATYTGLICKAADAGYKVVILLAGITESLRQQTQERIDEGIIGITHIKQGNNNITKRVGVGKDNQKLLAVSFTSVIKDFIGDHDKISVSLESQKSLVVFVVKKNVSVLGKLYKWLYEQNIDPIKGCVDVPMLLIDDEADNASINTKRDETDPTKTNKLIRQICRLFKNSTYVGFTATPFANVFIDPDSVDSMKNEDLFPENFIYALEAPSNYVGADKIFYKGGKYYNNICYITDIEEPDYTSDEYRDAVASDIDSLNSGPFYHRHKKEWNGILPRSLRESVLCFFLANVIRDLRGQSTAPRSMLVNMSRFIKVQKIITEHIEDIYEKVVDDIRYSFSENSLENINLPLYDEFKRLWNRYYSNVPDIAFDRVVKKENLLNAITGIKIVTVNGSKQSGVLDYKNNKALRVIAVGGLALSRGLTLEGLMVSYFYRNTATFDVLMQMGRWFGYRAGYDDIFQIWTSKTSAEWYAEVALASQELKDDIKNMFEQRLTPKDFGIKVRDNCSELQITAANKMRSASNYEMLYSFYGNIYDTPYVSYKIEHNTKNHEEVRNLVSHIFEGGYKFLYADQVHYKDADISDPSNNSSRYFADVPKSDIVSFLSKIKCSMANMNFNVKNILDFLNDDSNLNIEKWDVVFEGGKSKKHYTIPGLENITCIYRTIDHSSRNVVQISTRRRVLSMREGKFALSEEEISFAEKACIEKWKAADEPFEGRTIPLKAYFEFLPNRKPILVIMLIQPDEVSTDNKKKDVASLESFKKDLNGDSLVTFAIGLPGVKESERATKYKINKVYQNLFSDDVEPEDIDDDE